MRYRIQHLRLNIDLHLEIDNTCRLKQYFIWKRDDCRFEVVNFPFQHHDLANFTDDITIWLTVMEYPIYRCYNPACFFFECDLLSLNSNRVCTNMSHIWWTRFPFWNTWDLPLILMAFLLLILVFSVKVCVLMFNSWSFSVLAMKLSVYFWIMNFNVSFGIFRLLFFYSYLDNMLSLYYRYNIKNFQNILPQVTQRSSL